MSFLFCITTLHCNDRDTIFDVISSFCENTETTTTLSWIILAQGCSEPHLQRLREVLGSYPSIRPEILVWEDNRGWSKGMNALATASKKYEYVLHLEDDWICLPGTITGVGKRWLSACLEFMDHHRDVSTLFLRKYHDAKEKWQFGWTRTIPYMCHSRPDHFHYAQKMRSTVDGVETLQGIRFQEIPDFLYSANPCLRRDADYWRVEIFPFPEFLDIRENVGKGKTWGLTHNNHEQNQHWGFAEAFAMEKHLSLKTYNVHEGVFGHYEDWVSSLPPPVHSSNSVIDSRS